MKVRQRIKIAALTGLYLTLASSAFAQTAQNPDPSKWMCRNLADSSTMAKRYLVLALAVKSHRLRLPIDSPRLRVNQSLQRNKLR